MRTREVWHLTDEVGPCGRLLNHIFDLSVPHIITVAPGNDCTCRHKNAVVEGKWHVGGHHYTITGRDAARPGTIQAANFLHH